MIYILKKKLRWVFCQLQITILGHCFCHVGWLTEINLIYFSISQCEKLLFQSKILLFSNKHTVSFLMLTSQLQVYQSLRFFLLILWLISCNKYLSSLTTTGWVLDKMRHFNNNPDPLVKQGFSQYDANLSLFISTCKTVDSYTWLFPYLFLIRSQVSFSQIKVKVKQNKTKALTLQ